MNKTQLILSIIEDDRCFKLDKSRLMISFEEQDLSLFSDRPAHKVEIYFVHTLKSNECASQLQIAYIMLNGENVTSCVDLNAIKDFLFSLMNFATLGWSEGSISDYDHELQNNIGFLLALFLQQKYNLDLFEYKAELEQFAEKCDAFIVDFYGIDFGDLEVFQAFKSKDDFLDAFFTKVFVKNGLLEFATKLEQGE